MLPDLWDTSKLCNHFIFYFLFFCDLILIFIALTVLVYHSQQDAQEFLRFLLDGLHNEVNRVTVRPRGTVEDFDHLP